MVSIQLMQANEQEPN